MERNDCEHSELVCAYAVQALPASEVPMIEAHISSCEHCRRELARLGPALDAFVAWPADVLRPTASLQDRLARRIAADMGGEPVAPPARQWRDPDWEEVAPGIFVKLLATDTERHRVSMLVRLLPGVSYPPQPHADSGSLTSLEGRSGGNWRRPDPGHDRPAGPRGDHLRWRDARS
jgi:anti-sigma factor RsiW